MRISVYSICLNNICILYIYINSIYCVMPVAVMFRNMEVVDVRRLVFIFTLLGLLCPANSWIDKDKLVTCFLCLISYVSTNEFLTSTSCHYLFFFIVKPQYSLWISRERWKWMLSCWNGKHWGEPWVRHTK